MQTKNKTRTLLMALPCIIIFGAFFLLPMVRLFWISGQGPEGFGLYLAVLTNENYFSTLANTIFLSLMVTIATLAISSICGLFLTRQEFWGKRILISLLTFPLAFPGVVVGFMIILMVGRQGLLGKITSIMWGDKMVLAYSLTGLFLGYLYFSIPRVILTVMAAAEKIDIQLEEAARSLGANAFRVVKDIIIPALTPSLISAGALCFATSMGAFGTAFTLATDIDVLPMTIYTEFTLEANIAMASALSMVLGLITLAALSLARSLAGNTFAPAA